MPTVPLPEHPSLVHLRNQAKLVRDLVRSGDEGALSMVGEFHPRLDASDLDAAKRSVFKLSDAQLIVARMYRFDGWSKLRDHLKVVQDFSHTPPVELDRVADDESFVALAVLSYSDHGPSPVDRIAQAHGMLQADRSLATGSIEAVATVGDHVALATALDRGPEVVNDRCGPNEWPPLLYATYSRIATDEPTWSAIRTVEVLLDRGADPNAGFLWRGLVPPFTALTGAFGRGESGQPPHPDRLELARLLLEAGADPNDGQTLYNNGIGGQNHDDPRHLELLVSYGLGTQQHGPWYQRLGPQLREPSELLYDELEAAAHRGRPKMLAFLLDLGLDPDRTVGRRHMTPVRLAAEKGHSEILRLLAQAGVDITLEPAEAFLGQVRSGTGQQIRALLAEHPLLLERLLGEHPGVIKHVTGDGREVLATLIDLGFDINARTGGSGTTALHEAAQADDVALARLLVEHGADPDLPDIHIGSTPLGWATYGHHNEVAAFLQPLTDHHAPTAALIIRAHGTSVEIASIHELDRALDAIDREASEPVLVELESRGANLNIGLGRLDVSVALYLGTDGQPWHAQAEPTPPLSDNAIEFTKGKRRYQFHPRAAIAIGLARQIARQFARSPLQAPVDATWQKEGNPADVDESQRPTSAEPTVPTDPSDER